MSLFKNKKIVIFSLAVLVAFGALTASVNAATTKVNLSMGAQNQNFSTQKWTWVVNIDTEGTADNTDAVVFLYEKKEGEPNKQVGQSVIKKIQGNHAEYNTGSILDSGKTYSVSVVVEDKTGTIAQKVGGLANPTILSGDVTRTDTETDYTLLAPIPKVGKDGVVDTASGFGAYLNIMINVIIGICAALAMIMIVVGGIEYMTSELVSEKADGKSKITNAVLGLILALGAYAILNTLNSDLLDVGLGKLPEASVTIGDEREIYGMTSSSSGTPPSGAYGLCTQGFEQISTSGGTFWACKSISANLKKLIDAAWATTPQIKLAGGTYRSKQAQESLRSQHCGGQSAIYNQSAKCNPPTAYPGTSRHEAGLAIDFTCEGQSIGAQDNKCFVWLKNNAATYKMYNLASEPWHWSYDGK